VVDNYQPCTEIFTWAVTKVMTCTVATFYLASIELLQVDTWGLQ